MRPTFKDTEPLHVVARVERDVRSLRKRHMYKAIREATICVAKREDFRIVHLSIQSNHLHLIVEAKHRTALAKGMQSFQISAAKHINHAFSQRYGTRRRGRVFTDRYHARILNSPRSVRNAVAYVLNNWRHHGEDAARFARRWRIDPYSTGVFFGGWKEWLDPLRGLPAGYKPLVAWFPRSWLLREAWRQHGLVSLYEVPGKKRDGIDAIT